LHFFDQKKGGEDETSLPSSEDTSLCPRPGSLELSNLSEVK